MPSGTIKRYSYSIRPRIQCWTRSEQVSSLWFQSTNPLNRFVLTSPFKMTIWARSNHWWTLWFKSRSNPQSCRSSRSTEFHRALSRSSFFNPNVLSRWSENLQVRSLVTLVNPTQLWFPHTRTPNSTQTHSACLSPVLPCAKPWQPPSWTQPLRINHRKNQLKSKYWGRTNPTTSLARPKRRTKWRFRN